MAEWWVQKFDATGIEVGDTVTLNMKVIGVGKRHVTFEDTDGNGINMNFQLYKGTVARKFVKKETSNES